MSALRFLPLLALTLALMAAGVSAQGPGVKLPPQIKPGMPPKGPANPPPKAPVDPKGKNPLPPMGPGVPPGMPPIGPGIPPGTPGGPVAPPVEKKDEIKWPKEVNGKTVDAIVKDMRTNSDPAVREACVRALPAFGPKGREEGGDELLEALTKDQDWNVRLAALAVTPTVLLGYAKAPDTLLLTALAEIVKLAGHDLIHVRMEAITAVAACGPYIRTDQPKVVQTLINRSREGTTWQMRRAATACLGLIGQGMQKGDGPETKEKPDAACVTALFAILKSDTCAAVRREAVNSLIALGPVDGKQQKEWRTGLDNVFKFEKDKSVILWTRVCILRNDPSGVKGNENHLNEVAKLLLAPEPGAKIESCQALALLGEEAVSKLQGLLDVLTTIGEDPAVIVAAILAVTNMSSKDNVIVPHLQKLKMEHKNEDVRLVATDAIEYFAGRKKKK